MTSTDFKETKTSDSKADDSKEALLYSANFTVARINPDGKKFPGVSRIIAIANLVDVKRPSSELQIDIHTDNYIVRLEEELSIVLTKDESLKDQYEYVAHGKVYTIKGLDKDRVDISISFGGLLMGLQTLKQSVNIQVDQWVYCMIKKLL